MSYTVFHDISYAQGAYNMAADKNPVIALKMSGFYYGSKTGYYDAQAATNYRNALKYGKVPILYHFAGGGDPIKEADYFVGAVSPLAKGDVYCLDYELTAAMNPPANPVQWCVQYCERVHQKTGVWPIFYTYASLLAEHDFTPVLLNCGLWVADYGVPPTATVPTRGHPYIIHQYTDKPLDTDALFISVATLKEYAYGYVPKINPQKPPDPPPASTSTSTTVSTSTSTTTTTLPPPVPGTVVVPAETHPEAVTGPQPLGFWQALKKFLRGIWRGL